MNILGKIFGLVIIALIILIIVNIRSILPYFDQLAFGGGGGISPTEIGNDYINQINQLSPKIPQTTYAGDVQSPMYVPAGASAGTVQTKKSRVFAEKVGSVISLTTENLIIPQNLQGRLHIWIANSPTISATMNYIDMGTLRSGGVQIYRNDLGTNPYVSLAEYKYVIVINSENYSIYTQATLSN